LSVSLRANLKYVKRSAGAVGVLVLALLVAFTLGVLWPLATVQPARSAALAIVNVSVVDVEAGTLVPAQTVLIENGHIVALGPAREIAVPQASTVIDGRDRFLMPGLWDMHAHVYAVSPLLDLPLYIAYGVTNVRDMQGCPLPDDPFIACAQDKQRWTDEAVAAQRVGPRIVSSTSFMANGPGMSERIKGVPEFFDTATPEQARAFVRHFSKQNVQAIKVYDRIPREAYFALVDEANKLGLEVVGHRPYAVSAAEAAAHQKSIEHARFILHESFGSEELRSAGVTPSHEDRRRMLEEHEPDEADAIFAAMKSAGTWYVPTHLTRWVDAYADDPSVREDPLLRYVHPLLKRQWLEDVDATLADDPSQEARATYREFYRKGLELTAAAHRAGVKVLVGTDYIIAGADVHRELAQLVLAGLTPADALRAATVQPTEYFGLEQQYGVVAIGAVADLVLLDANPLEDIRNTQRIEAVIFNGNLYDRTAIDRISTHVQMQARSWSVGCKILWRFIKNPVGY
jgi:imidazolonepropionase-like amidohydrolase